MEIPVKESKKFTHPQLVSELCYSILRAEQENDQNKEHFWVIGLDVKLKVRYVELVSLGNLTASVVSPRETFRLAIIKNVASIIAVHNHPSGEVEPSGEDIRITKQLVEAGKILGISVRDHVVIGEVTSEGYFSMNETRTLDF